jgi:MYXO-CTERM domain-containing protein
MGMTKRIAFLLGTVLTLSLLSTPARAHWCNDLWGSAYNIVVRPASDTVTVPSSGSGSLEIYVQNNMGYLLPNFVLKATATGAAITASRQTQKVANTLMPGEKAKFTLAVSRSSGSTLASVAVGDISFGVTFGDSGQSGSYPNSPGKAVMIRKSDGSLVPSPPPPGIGTGNGQARQLQFSAVADFSNVDTGLDKLMSLYCAGRKSWGADDDSVITSACSGTATDCTKASRSVSVSVGTKFDYTKLWAAGELAARKGSLGARTATLHTRLQCGASDTNVTFAGFAMMVMGYLGDDAGSRSFLEGKVSTSGDLGTIAKAALYLMGDKAKYESDVTAGLKASSKFVQAACAAAVGIVNKDDTQVGSVLIPLAKWQEPDVSGQENGLYASHLLALVAWDRRGWAANADDKGAVTFYGDSTIPTGGSSGTSGSSGAAGASGAAGSSAVPPPAGSTVVTSGGAKGGSVASGGATPPKGGNTTVNPPAGNTTPTSSVKGGNTTPPVGGNTPVQSSGNPPVGGNVSPTAGQAGGGVGPAAGNTGVDPVGGKTGTNQGGEEDPNQVGEGGASGAQGTGTGQKGSAGGCSFGSTAPAPLAFLLAALGLALALRRRSR